MKPPAFLFYSQDFLIGTLTLPMEDRGKYITLLCCMNEHGRLTEDAAYSLVGELSDKLRSKFKSDENGLLYNLRLEKEIKGRAKFVTSRRSNASAKTKKKPTTLTLLQTDEVPPQPQQVKECFINLGLQPIEAEFETLKFMAYYTGTGWKTNRGKPLLSWKAAVTKWHIRSKQFIHNNHKTAPIPIMVRQTSEYLC